MKPTKSDATRRQEIRRFLMARRAVIAPESVGLSSGLRRRTPGLRREEVATLAGIGVTWYTWFEQGRDIRVSARLLERVAQTLRLTPSDTDYLFSLSGVPRTEIAPDSDEGVPEYFQDTIEGFTAGPAILFSQHWDVLAYNRLADRVYEFDNYSGPFARNHMWRAFMDPHRRAKYLDFETLAEAAVRLVRSAHGQMPEDAYLSSLIQALCEGSEVFRRLWEAQLTSRPVSTLPMGMTLPQFGALHFTTARFRAFDSKQTFLMFTPADARTATVMRKLAATERYSRRRPSRKRQP